MLGLGGYGDLLASIRLADRPEVVLGRALARGRSLDEGCGEAKLRVEAISLIPRIARFATEARIAAPTFDALLSILGGGGPAGPAGLVETMFAG
jgi:glycerol-3-phosphate dehydrogenase (NAD(P)+)